MEYIDLGLPSGNLWASENEEDCYNFNDAPVKFGDNIPTKEDFEELITHCWKRFDNERMGMELMGDNGNKLFLSFQGYHVGKSEYHLVTFLNHKSEFYNDSILSIIFHFYRKEVILNDSDGIAVRLVNRKM